MVQELLVRVGQRRQGLRQVESKVKGYECDVDRHFEGVRTQAVSAFTKENGQIDENARGDEERVNLWAEKEIKRIMEERDARIKLIQQKTQTQKEAVAIAQRDLVDELLNIKSKIDDKIGVVKTQLQSLSLTLGDAHHHLDELLLSDKDLIRDAEHFESKATGACVANVAIELAESATRLASKVHLEEVGDVVGCRIAAFQDSWELTETIPIPADLAKPYFIGAVGSNQMVLSDVSCRALYVTDLEERVTTKVLVCTGDRTITSCISLGEDKILCGNYRGGTTEKSFNGF